jgi:pimeloyl-ACP methyl ester carboxylesterase
VIALVHGLGCSHRYFARLLPLLPGALCPDLGGDSVAGLADELDAAVPDGAALLVANSLGCEVAVELALRRRGRVSGLVLIGPTVDPQRRRLLPQLGTLLADVPREPWRLLAVEVVDYARWGLRRLLRTARSMLDDPIEAKLGRLEVPVAVMRGAHDPICPQAWGETAASLAPRGRLVVVPGAAHAVHWSHPGAVARIVEELQQELREG